MPDWSQSMQQTFEFYKVNAFTWQDTELLKYVKSCSITWDLTAETLGSATFDIDEEIGETYIRVYLITIQNGVREKFELGTFLVQTLPSSFDGKKHKYNCEAYTPLLELKEKYPPLGYFLPKEATNIMNSAFTSARENMRAPVIRAINNKTLFEDYVADPSDTWLETIRNLVTKANYEMSFDSNTRLTFTPKREIESLTPIWTYDDGNSSILYPEVDSEKDLYGIPNVVEIYATSGANVFHSVAENNEVLSPVSIKNRGRKIIHRETDPEIMGGIPTNYAEGKQYVDDYAERVLKNLSSIENTITYEHGYCPVRVGDCVRINYARAGMSNIRAKVISQTIKCEPGCPVTEKAIYTTKFYGG